MREIKFRAWSLTGKDKYNRQRESKMIYNAEQTSDDENGDSFNCILDENEYIAEQYTGLKDKNGREIYEGDIVRFNEYYTCPVVYYGCCFIADGYNNGDYYSGDDPLGTEWDKCEVIGNIHENQELLK